MGPVRRVKCLYPTHQFRHEKDVGCSFVSHTSRCGPFAWEWPGRKTISLGICTLHTQEITITTLLALGEDVVVLLLAKGSTASTLTWRGDGDLRKGR